MVRCLLFIVDGNWCALDQLNIPKEDGVDFFLISAVIEVHICYSFFSNLFTTL